MDGLDLDIGTCWKGKKYCPPLVWPFKEISLFIIFSCVYNVFCLSPHLLSPSKLIFKLNRPACAGSSLPQAIPASLPPVCCFLFPGPTRPASNIHFPMKFFLNSSGSFILITIVLWGIGIIPISQTWKLRSKFRQPSRKRQTWICFPN